MNVEELLRDAMAEEGAEVRPPADRWTDVEAAAASARRRQARGRARARARARARQAGGFAVLAVAVASAAALFVVPALYGTPSGHKVSVHPADGARTTTAPAPPTPTTASPTATPTTATPTTAATPKATRPSTTRPSTTRPSTTRPSTTTPTVPVPTSGQGYLPLYPFAGLQEADAWQAASRATGSQPWHLDPGQTALSFAGFLGYSGIDTVISVHADATGDHVAVGYTLPSGGTSTAAVVHLRRFGSGAGAPWEVVGTDDTANFSITSPRYGSVTASPVAIGGAIDEVDPNVRAEILQLSSQTPLGTACCWPANLFSPGKWSLSVPYQGATDPVLVVSASNAGGLEQVAQFAVTGIRTTPGATPGL